MSINQRIELLHELIDATAAQSPSTEALVCRKTRLTYAGLADLQDRFAAAAASVLGRGARVGIWMSKSAENVAASFGATKAGLIFVPINPVLKPAQVGHILRDCTVELLITSADRLPVLADELSACPSVQLVVVTGTQAVEPQSCPAILSWDAFVAGPGFQGVAQTGNDVAAIFYTSGSTGMPKGVVVPHRSFVSGAASVATYLGNGPHDRILATMPLSFDAGFSQLTTAFFSGATCVMLDYLLPAEVFRTIRGEAIQYWDSRPCNCQQLSDHPAW